MVSDELKQDLETLEANMREAGMPEGTHLRMVLVKCPLCGNQAWMASKDNLGTEPAPKECSWCNKEAALTRVDGRVLHITLDETGSKMWLEG